MVKSSSWRGFAILTLTSALFTSCISGPKRENDSPLDYLNGNNYRAGSAAGVLPFVKRQAPATSVSGILLIEASPLPLPLKYQTVVLARGSNEVARTLTDATGNFILAGEISNGSYVIKLDSAKFSMSQNLEILDYKTEGLRLIAAAKNE